MISIIGRAPSGPYHRPMQKILVPLDSSEQAEKALPVAMQLARRWQAELLVVRVVNPYVAIPAGTPELALQFNEIETRESAEYLEKVAARVEKAGLTCTPLVAFGQPVPELVRLLENPAVRLICLASQGRSGVGRWLLGSVAEGVLRQAPCPVLLCRGEMLPGPLGFERVLVPLDGGPLSAEVLPRLEPFLVPEPQITLLRASDDLVRLAPVDPGTYRRYLDGLRGELERLDPEKRYGHVVRDQTPSAAVLEQADAQRAELIAMATHGRHGLHRFLVGSVTERVARHANCPVLAFPPAAVGLESASHAQAAHR